MILKERTDCTLDRIAYQAGGYIVSIFEVARLVPTNGHPPLPMNDTVQLEGVVISIARKP